VLDVPAGEVAERPLAGVFVLDQLAITAGLGCFGRVLARPGLDRGLLITAHDEIAWFEQLPLPAALIQVEDPPGLVAKLRVAGK
jgi:hypothetical protein